MTYSPMFDCPGYKGEVATAARYALNRTGTADDGTALNPWGKTDLYQDPKTGKFVTPTTPKHASIPPRNKAITDITAADPNHSGHQNALYFDWHVARVAVNN
jgi:prepilin-type processing-associated H-X9-DG protein